jgi:hypothetical protein
MYDPGKMDLCPPSYKLIFFEFRDAGRALLASPKGTVTED